MAQRSEIFVERYKLIVTLKESEVSCHHFIGVYDFCTLSLTEVMIATYHLLLTTYTLPYLPIFRTIVARLN